jgi:hypothetical protein
MFQINGIPCVFSKVFDVETRVADVVEAFVDEHDGNCVVHFIDVAATPAVVSIVENVVKAGGHVSYWDHHVPTPPRTPRDQEYMAALTRLVALGVEGKAAGRKDFPGCAQLLPVGTYPALAEVEMGGKVLVVADQDFDGLLGAMALCGASYSGLEEDAGILDGPRGGYGKLTPLAKVGSRRPFGFTAVQPAEARSLPNRVGSLGQRLYVAAAVGDSAAEDRPDRHGQGVRQGRGRRRGSPTRSTGVDNRLVYCALPPGSAAHRPRDASPPDGAVAGGGYRPREDNGSDRGCRPRPADLDRRRQALPGASIDLRDAVAGLPTGPKEGIISNVPFSAARFPGRLDGPGLPLAHEETARAEHQRRAAEGGCGGQDAPVAELTTRDNAAGRSGGEEGVWPVSAPSFSLRTKEVLLCVGQYTMVIRL